jgi:hypothetical protein
VKEPALTGKKQDRERASPFQVKSNTKKEPSLPVKKQRKSQPGTFGYSVTLR